MTDLLIAQSEIKARRQAVRDGSGKFVRADVAAHQRAILLERTRLLYREVYQGAAPVKRHIRHLHRKETHAEGFL